MRRCAALLALVVATLAAGDAAGAAEPEKTTAPAPPALGVTVRETAAARLVQAVVPGELVGVALPRVRSGARRVLLLAAAAGDRTGERTLYELDLLAVPPRLLTIRAGLPPGLDALDAADLEEDGRQELLLGEPGRLSALPSLREADGRTPRAPRLVLEQPGFDLRSPLASRLRAPAAGKTTLVGAEPGRLWAFHVAGGALAPLCRAVLPLEAEREARGLLLSTPATVVLADPDEPAQVAVGPQAFGKTRLRTRLLTLAAPASPSTECAASDAWSRLPAPEKVEESWYLLADGQPLLAVATTDATKLGLFESLKLRIFTLGADRTRAGRGPSFTIESETRRWQRLEPLLRDLDGDGHDDLVLVQPEGMKGKKLRVEAFLGKGGGRFAERGLATTLDLRAAAWSFGPDADGDGRPDLVTLGGGRLAVFTGVPPGRDGILHEKAWRELELGAPSGKSSVTVELGDEGVSTERERGAELYAVDLEGAGKAATLLLTVSEQGRGMLRIVRWKSP